MLGLFLGLVLALSTSRLLSGLLFGVTVGTPAPYLAVSLLLLGTAVVACLAPAVRAMRIDPATALRSD